MIQSSKKSNIHTISIYVTNKPGVLVRCAQIFARRGFNIDSLVVSPSVNPKYSRMTITMQGDPAVLEQIIKQTSKLIDVLHCSEHTGLDSLDREYALVKVKCPSTKRIAIKNAIKGHAHIVDDSQGVMVIGQYGTTAQLNTLEQKLKSFGIIEMVRSGKIVIARGQEPT